MNRLSPADRARVKRPNVLPTISDELKVLHAEGEDVEPQFLLTAFIDLLTRHGHRLA